MRSLLIVPADRPSLIEEGLVAGADALVLDLERSVEPSRKGEARRMCLRFLLEAHSRPAGPRLLVRINPLDSPFAESDLDVIMTGRPEGVVLPRCRGGRDVARLASRLAVREALHGAEDGATRIIPVAMETPDAPFHLGTYAGSSPRLCAIACGAGGWPAQLGASSDPARSEPVLPPVQTWRGPREVARYLCLSAAGAAGVPVLDCAEAGEGGLEALQRECVAAVRDGFSGKFAASAAEVATINAAFAFTPAPATAAPDA